VTDKDEDKAAEEAKKQHDEKIMTAYKSLAATGFSKEQAAQQLSSKFQMTVDAVSAVIEQNDDDENEKGNKNKAPARKPENHKSEKHD
jgi:hypothetical protein